MTIESIKLFLKQYPLFNCLSDLELDLLTENAEIRNRPKLSFIYHEDEPSNDLFFLLKGIIKTGTHSEDGREVIKSIIHPLAMFGELGLVGETNRTEFARSMNESTLFLVISVDDFRQLMHSNYRLSMNFLHRIGSRLRKSESRLESLIFKDARQRIVDFLKDTAVKQGRKVGFEMTFKHCLTQQDIANITGTSRQTVTSVLNELRKENLIYFNRRTFLIRNFDNLS